MTIKAPLALVAGNHFEGKFTDKPTETSLNYINLPRARRIVPVDALSWVAAFNAGYEPQLDCTAVSHLSQPGLISFKCMFYVPVFELQFERLPSQIKSHVVLTYNQVELPYKGGELSLVLLLPGRTNQFLAGGLTKLEDKIDSDSWERLLG